MAGRPKKAAEDLRGASINVRTTKELFLEFNAAILMEQQHKSSIITRLIVEFVREQQARDPELFRRKLEKAKEEYRRQEEEKKKKAVLKTRKKR